MLEASYGGDSFFTLTTHGQIGLALLSSAMALGLILLVRRVGHGRPQILRLLLALGSFWLFVWLSPQIYYTYYRAIIDGLPAQIVVGAPPGPGQIAALLTFTGRAALNAHGQGLLGWAMALAALVSRRR